MVKQLSESEFYGDRVNILLTVPGLGFIAAMELLLELQDVAHSHVLVGWQRMWGLHHLRAVAQRRFGRCEPSGREVLVEIVWYVMGRDVEMPKKYESIKACSGSKWAIVANARTLLLRAIR